MFDRISVVDHEKAMKKLQERMEVVFEARLASELEKRDTIWRAELAKKKDNPNTEYKSIPLPNIKTFIRHSSWEGSN